MCICISLWHIERLLSPRCCLLDLRPSALKIYIYFFRTNNLRFFCNFLYLHNIAHCATDLLNELQVYFPTIFFRHYIVCASVCPCRSVCVCVCLRADRTFHSSLLSPRRTAPHFGTCLLQVNCCYVLLTLTSINLLLSFCHFQALHRSLPHILPYCVPWRVVLTYRHVFGIHRNIVGDKVVWYWLTVV